MARKITDKTETSAPTSTYPYGNIKDETGSQSGTPVNKPVYSDLHQFFARLADWVNVTLNGLPDNAKNGFQFFESVALLSEANMLQYFATNVPANSDFGSSDLADPFGCFMEEETGILFVTDNDPGNERVYAFDVKNDNSRVTSKEPNMDDRRMGGCCVKGDYLLVPYYDTGLDNILLYSFELSTGTGVDSIFLWDTTMLVAGQKHRPDCAFIGDTLYVTKGDVEDVGGSASYDTEIKAVDISDPTNLSSYGAVVTGPLENAYSTIETIIEENVFYVSLDYTSEIESYDLYGGNTSPSKMETITGIGTSFHITGERFQYAFGDIVAQYRRHGAHESLDSKSRGNGSSGNARGVTSYHHPSKDVNGLKNYKLFVVDGSNSRVAVWERKMNAPS